MINEKTWEERQRLADAMQAKLAGRVSTRVALVMARASLYQGFSIPIEEATDKELLGLDDVGPKTLVEIRKVFPRTTTE